MRCSDDLLRKRGTPELGQSLRTRCIECPRREALPRGTAVLERLASWAARGFGTPGAEQELALGLEPVGVVERESLHS